jgi:hypothetical protein
MYDDTTYDNIGSGYWDQPPLWGSDISSQQNTPRQSETTPPLTREEAIAKIAEALTDSNRALATEIAEMFDLDLDQLE